MSVLLACVDKTLHEHHVGRLVKQCVGHVEGGFIDRQNGGIVQTACKYMPRMPNRPNMHG